MNIPMTVVLQTNKGIFARIQLSHIIVITYFSFCKLKLSDSSFITIICMIEI